MTRGIDHIVLVSRDLDRLAGAFGRLGFTLTPRARHPFGTDNQLAQLQGDFIELLGVARPDDIEPPSAKAFSFGGYIQEFLESGDGFSMVALKSNGWQADRAHFAACGLELHDPFEFSRKAGQPDGSEVTVGFKLTIARHPDMPRAVFFTCDHQHEARFFYKPQFQSHANTAVALGEVMMVADDPAACASYFEALIGDGAVSRYDDGLMVQAGSAVISISPRRVLAERFLGAAVGPTPGPQFVGYGVAVADIEATRARLQTSGLDFQQRGNSIWLCGPETGQAVLEFTQGEVTD